MSAKRRFLSLAAALLLAACAPPSEVPATPPGETPPPVSTTPPATPTTAPAMTASIEGQVLVGPMCPVIREDQPCPDQPYSATITLLDKAGHPLAQFSADAEGHFHLELEPGSYTLIPKGPAEQRYPIPPGPIPLTVTAGQFVSLTITYDSGIR